MLVHSWERWAPLAGIVFIVLVIAGLFLLWDFPDPDASEQEILDYYNDSDVHARNILGYFLWVLAGVAFSWFAASLYNLVQRARGEADGLAALALITAGVFVAVFYIAGTFFVAIAGAIEFGDTPTPDADWARILPQAGFGLLLVGGAFSASLFILAISIDVWQTRALPRWAAWLGFLASLVLIFSFLFIPMIALPIWMLAISIAFLTRGTEAIAPASAG